MNTNFFYETAVAVGDRRVFDPLAGPADVQKGRDLGVEEQQLFSADLLLLIQLMDAVHD